MNRRPPGSTRTHTLFPNTPLFRSARAGREFPGEARRDCDPCRALQHAVPLSLGSCRRVSEAPLCAEPPRRALLARAARPGACAAAAYRPARAVARPAAVGVGLSAARRDILGREPIGRATGRERVCQEV